MPTTIDLENLINMDDICELFGVRQMTIWNWRKKEDDPLPELIIPGHQRNNVRFDFDAIEEWGRRNSKNMPGLAKIRKRINNNLRATSPPDAA